MDMLLEMKNISKIFPGVRALDNVTYVLRKGEINALLGENGAGKSTLIKVISGVHTPTQGSIYMEGKEVKIHTPFDAQQLGIGTIHQEFNLFPNLSVLQNIAFSLHLVPFSGRILPWKKIRSHVEEILDTMEITLPLDTKIKYLTVANQQLVEIAKALMLNVRILIMDEPTDHLDMESITALNNGMIKFPGVILFASRDHQIVQTTANRIIEFLPDGTIIDKVTTYDEYLESDEMARKRQVYSTSASQEEDD